MTLRVAVGQMCSTSNVSGNARVAAKLIDRAREIHAKVLFLPEAADYISRDAAHSQKLAQKTHSDFISVIQEKLRNGPNDLCVAVGIHEPEGIDPKEIDPGHSVNGISTGANPTNTSTNGGSGVTSTNTSDGANSGVTSGVNSISSANVSNGVNSTNTSDGVGSGVSGSTRKVRNNLVWIDDKGNISQRYQKLHLFDINIPNGPILKESNSVEAGKKVLAPFAVSPDSKFNVGFSICYDIRFPELATKLRKLGANIITYPSAFTTRTGEAHWVTLGRARAIDSQCYVIMAAQCGLHDVNADLGPDAEKSSKPRESFGQSLIIGPWGEILAEASDYTNRGPDDESGDYYELVHADLDFDALQKVRQNLPVFDHRREDLYK